MLWVVVLLMMLCGYCTLLQDKIKKLNSVFSLEDVYLQKKKRWYWVLWLYRWQKRPAKPTAYTCLELWLHEIITKSLVRAAILQKQQHYCTHNSCHSGRVKTCVLWIYICYPSPSSWLHFLLTLLCLSGDLRTHTFTQAHPNTKYTHTHAKS